MAAFTRNIEFLIIATKSALSVKSSCLLKYSIIGLPTNSISWV